MNRRLGLLAAMLLALGSVAILGGRCDIDVDTDDDDGFLGIDDKALIDGGVSAIAIQPELWQA